MTSLQAKKLVRAAPEYAKLVEAAATLCRDPDVTKADLIACLRLGGLAAEFAAIRLYQLHGRKMPAADKVNFDPAFWKKCSLPRSRVKQSA
jgi:hypothetical protein